MSGKAGAVKKRSRCTYFVVVNRLCRYLNVAVKDVYVVALGDDNVVIVALAAAIGFPMNVDVVAL